MPRASTTAVPDTHVRCNAPLDGGGTCVRYAGHKKGSHRATLMSERVTRYHNMTPEERERERAERAASRQAGGAA